MVSRDEMCLSTNYFNVINIIYCDLDTLVEGQCAKYLVQTSIFSIE